MKRAIYFGSFILIAILSACTTKMYTSIDVLRPADFTFDKGAKSLLIVNNTIPQPATYGHQVKLMDEKKRNSTINTDSLAMFCLSVINEEFQKNEFFPHTSFQMESIKKEGTFFVIDHNHNDSLKLLAQKCNADVVLLLDRIKVNDIVQDIYNQTNSSYYAVLEAYYQTNWSIYYPSNETLEKKVYMDTIYWDKEAYIRKMALQGLPDRYNALIDGALHVGQETMKRFVPWWDKEDRYFFSSNNKYLKQGMDSVSMREWDEAIKIWKKGVIKTKGNTKGMLLYNIAVANEITGNTDEAVNNLKLSIAAFEKTPMVNYQHIFTVYQYQQALEKRLKEIELIKKQLGEVN